MRHFTVFQSLRPFLRPKRLAIAEACLIGLVSGLAAVWLKQGTGWLGTWRIAASHLWATWLVLPGVGLLGGLLAGVLIQRVAPEAAGSGIPQVKAALADVPLALDLRVAVIKLLSTTLALGSGFSLGRQGPTVHIGAALAAQLSRWIPTSPGYRRQLLAAGAAAGLAAGFNAPLAGVLFVVEELLQDFSGVTLGSAILASFIGATVSRLLGGQGLGLGKANLIDHSFSLSELPWFLLLGILAGVLGALFNRGILTSLSLYRQFFKVSLPWRMAIAGLLSGSVMALLPAYLRDSAGLQDVLVMGGATWEIPAIAFLSKFLLTLVAYGSGCPGGLFAPSLILGSALGYQVSLLAHLLPDLGHPLGLTIALGSPTTYALTGMGAFFSAVTRGPITAIVIVFEMTADFNLVLPLMIGSVVAYLVSETLFGGSIYKHLLEWNGIHLEKDTLMGGALGDLTAADIMQRRVETLSSQLTLDETVQAFSRSHHRGFPVVDDGKLVGIVTQSDLATISQRQLLGTKFLQEIITPQPVTVRPEDSLTHVLYLLNRHKISRLPVTEGRKLIGIITRADIIRAESDQLSGSSSPLGPQPEPSYVVYQTRGPATGQGRLLVPLSNPHTATALVQMALAIAQERDYELECLQVILVPRSRPPSETPVRTTTSRRLLEQAVRLGQQLDVPVHTQVRVAHDVAQAILETIKDRHIDLTLMGWKGSTVTPGRVFGGTVDTLIRQAGCDVILVRLPSEKSLAFNRWLVPMAGGPNSLQAVRLLPALTSLGNRPEVRLCQVFQPSDPHHDMMALDQATQFLNRHLPHTVIAMPMCASSVADAIIDLSRQKQCDVIMLGATRETLLQQAIKGNIPEAIARQSSCAVVLVRRAIT